MKKSKSLYHGHRFPASAMRFASTNVSITDAPSGLPNSSIRSIYERPTFDADYARLLNQHWLACERWRHQSQEDSRTFRSGTYDNNG